MSDPQTTPTTPPLLSRRFHFNWPISLGILALVLVAALWLHERDQSRIIKTDLAKRLAEADATIKEGQLLARNADDLSRQNATRLSQLESQVVGSKEQQLALENLYKELARDRDQRALADVEQMLLSASQQLIINRNVTAAILGLEAADQRLQRLDKPQFARLRQTIENDLAHLRATPQVDQVGINFRLNLLAEATASWPLSSAYSHQPASTDKTKQSLGQGVLEEFRNLIRIRHIDDSEPALLAPDQDYFLRQNLKLRLLSARLALLSDDASSYKTDLNVANKLISRYFNPQDAAVASAKTELNKLAAINIAPSLPDISASLNTAQSFYRGQ